MTHKKKPTTSLARSSAAEYLTFVVAGGTGGVEAVYANENDRAEATKEHMGLHTWSDAPHGKIQKFDVVVVRNYMTESKLTQLSGLVNAYLDVAEDMSLAYALCMLEAVAAHPDWDRLYETAAGQQGMFTTKQAAEAGYSPQLLVHHTRAGKTARVRRGIYRLVHFPPGEHEELVIAWLWSEQAGVLSHRTALALHGLSDVLPAHVHITLPSDWCHRRFRVPPDVVLHHANLVPEDRAWFGTVPVTTPRRTLSDCAKEGLSPEVLGQAARQALRRGLVAKSELGDVETALEPFGGIGA